MKVVGNTFNNYLCTIWMITIWNDATLHLIRRSNKQIIIFVLLLTADAGGHHLIAIDNWPGCRQLTQLRMNKTQATYPVKAKLMHTQQYHA